MKYRLIHTKNKYFIQIYKKAFIIFGIKFVDDCWVDAHILDIGFEKGELKDNGWMEYHPLRFNELKDAEYVYDSIIKNNTLSQECLKIIFGLNTPENIIEILRQN